jgi:hypothetical protein
MSQRAYTFGIILSLFAWGVIAFIGCLIERCA